MMGPPPGAASGATGATWTWPPAPDPPGAGLAKGSATLGTVDVGLVIFLLWSVRVACSGFLQVQRCGAWKFASWTPVVFNYSNIEKLIFSPSAVVFMEVF